MSSLKHGNTIFIMAMYIFSKTFRLSIEEYPFHENNCIWEEEGGLRILGKGIERIPNRTTIFFLSLFHFSLKRLRLCKVLKILKFLYFSTKWYLQK